VEESALYPIYLDPCSESENPGIRVVSPSPENLFLVHFGNNSRQKEFLDRIASQTIAACAASVAPSMLIITRINNILILFGTLSQGSLDNMEQRPSIPNRRRHPTNFSNYVPLQTREHALAGISGMLRLLAGAQGAFTSRGAKP